MIRPAHVFASLLTLATFAAYAEDTAGLPTESFGSAQAQLEIVLDQLGLQEAAADGRLAIALVTMDGQQATSLAMKNGHQMMYAASLPKIAILYGAAVAIDRDRLVLTEALKTDINAMIRQSCNRCATRVLEAVGREWLLELLQSEPHRFYDPEIGGGLWVGKDYARQGAFRRDPLLGLSHAATAWQAARWYLLLKGGHLASPEQTELMLSALKDPAINHKFIKGIESRPVDVVYRKSGTWRNYHSDSLLLTVGSRSFILVALTNDPAAGRWLEQIAGRIYDQVMATE
jgi:beta-lactamase class A